MASHLDLDPEKVTAVLREAAETEILPRFRALESHEIMEKGPGDLVTVADRASEKLLTRRLSGLIPTALMIGEEAHEVRPEALVELKDADWAWIIDPLDGTHNFAHGTARFAIIVALLRRGETAMGWIYDPNAAVVAVAQAGAGALIGGSQASLPPAPKISDMVGSLAPRRADSLRARQSTPDGPPLPCDFRRYRCVGLEYIDLALGKLNFARYAGKLMPWDHAAGVLMYREAGGHDGMTADGRPYAPSSPRPADALLLAPNRDSWKGLHAVLE